MVDLSGPEGAGQVGQHFSTGNYLEATSQTRKRSQPFKEHKRPQVQR